MIAERTTSGAELDDQSGLTDQVDTPIQPKPTEQTASGNLAGHQAQPSLTLMHLYSDVLNLYGENGNIKVLARALQAAGCSVQIKRSSLGQDIDLSDCDLVYIGCGTETKQMWVLKHLREQRNAICDYLESGGLLLATGNAGDLFGNSIIMLDGSSIEALNLFDYQAIRREHRGVGEVLFRFNQEHLIGFQNCGSKIVWQTKIPNPLFVVTRGFVTESVIKDEQEVIEDIDFEGFRVNNFIATTVLGLLTRNPAFLVWLAELLIYEKNPASTYPEKNSANKNYIKLAYKEQKDMRESTISAYQLFDLQLDVDAYKAFLANHHSILDS